MSKDKGHERRDELPTLKDTLLCVLDLYARDKILANATIEEYANSSFEEEVLRTALLVPPEDQLEEMRRTAQEAKAELERKMLLQFEGEGERFRNLEKMTDKVSSKDRPYEEYHATRLDLIGAAHNATDVDSYVRTKIEEEIAEKRIDAEIVHFFLNNLDPMVEAINRLSDDDFKKLVPDHLAAPFRELHVNAILGNFGTAAILCGAILEHAYKDLLNTEAVGAKAIEEAKVAGLLPGELRISAYRVKRMRDEVVHGGIHFDALRSDVIWDLIVKTRRLIEVMYRDRLLEGAG